MLLKLLVPEASGQKKTTCVLTRLTRFSPLEGRRGRKKHVFAYGFRLPEASGAKKTIVLHRIFATKKKRR